ncbi:MAG: tRNA (adenosine(37)-N6)-threonylcarbamoyltransferase complex ATPase subunit type 1 TsaE [Candidatus Marinimicrobia bacterium]|jgi:tRNA threonylcarbamoyladenosine biosynthesis protein TsaE|nr:tRNA (adenosine(37)-N6)-threonylcarbamoyltransferase complex ATPase subunit type 1 TsaE [Candidatus Neomarinimicrobiota bacterium]
MSDLNSETHEIMSSDDMEFLGKKLAKKIPVGTVIGLKGELGSGKTTFAKGFAKGLGINAHVTSPTFKIVSEYETESCTLFHVDCYRLNDYTEFISMDAERFLYPEDGITLIEWVDRIEEIIPEDCPIIKFKLGDGSENHRIVKLIGLNF